MVCRRLFTEAEGAGSGESGRAVKRQEQRGRATTFELIDIAAKGRGGHLHAIMCRMGARCTGVCFKEAEGRRYKDPAIFIKGRRKCGGTRCQRSEGAESASSHDCVKQKERHRVCALRTNTRGSLCGYLFINITSKVNHCHQC